MSRKDNISKRIDVTRKSIIIANKAVKIRFVEHFARGNDQKISFIVLSC